MELLAGIVCLFPVPIVFALYYMYKNEEHSDHSKF